ncbi:GNAT family N-acetyltransferase [Agromyces sp. NPDC049794]|uniref:GNAT family N-acetyltransferase n=1 Tax=unclassified Agromyces TaxID=2639701 RepID=UPI0033E0ED80
MTDPVTLGWLCAVEECAAIQPLVQAHIDYERSSTVMPADWSITVGQLIAAGDLVIVVAWLGASAVGYASVTTDVATWSGRRFAHLDCLFVAERYRGANIGRLLVDAVAEHVRSLGLQELQWQTPDWNTGAIRFYERLGATHRPKARFALTL